MFMTRPWQCQRVNNNDGTSLIAFASIAEYSLQCEIISTLALKCYKVAFIQLCNFTMRLYDIGYTLAFKLCVEIFGIICKSILK